MLKKILLVTLALMLVVVFSGVASAHWVSITQSDADYNFAFVGQYSVGFNHAEIDQSSDSELNVALVVQQGSWCEASVIQEDSSLLNFALVEQGDGTLGPLLTIEEKINELAGMYYYWVVCFDCPPC